MSAIPPPYSSWPPSANEPCGCRRGQQGSTGYGSAHPGLASIHEQSPLIDRKANSVANRPAKLLLVALIAVLLAISISYPILENLHRKELRQKDRWVSGELRRKDRSLALERLQLAGEIARLTEDKATLAAEWDKLFSREEAIRREEDRQGRDVERRLRSNIHWGSLQRDDACVGWQKMLYSAELQGLPHDVDGVAWCQETSIDIYNTVFDKPDYCEKTSLVSSLIFPSFCLTHHLVLLDAGSCDWTLDTHRRAALQHNVGGQGRLGTPFRYLDAS
jgi:hypothetical protein